MGADRVLLRSSSDVHSLSIITDAKEFFDHFFTNFVQWEKKNFPFQRGAWLRIYGVPIHAWNESFLNCVFLTVDGSFVLTLARWRKKDLITLEYW